MHMEAVWSVYERLERKSNMHGRLLICSLRGWILLEKQYACSLRRHRLTVKHSFKSPAIAAVIARYNLLRQNTAICIHV